MTSLNRRHLLAAGAAALAGPALAQQPGHEHHGPQYERLSQPGRIEKPELATTQNVFDLPAPKAASPGRWSAKAPLPLPRSEMAWATAFQDRMHVVGGYGEQRTDRAYHHVYDPGVDTWNDGAPLPQGANHVGVAFLDGKLFAIGGFLEQNRKPHPRCFTYDPKADRWAEIAALPRAAGSTAVVGLDGVLHVIGGAIGETTETKRSVDWHLVYDPKSDRWSERTPLPTARDHTGTLAIGKLIHVIGGRVDPSTLTRTCTTPTTRQPTNGRCAHRCRPVAPGTAPCSIAARSSSWAERAPTASSARWRPMTRRAMAGNNMRRC